MPHARTGGAHGPDRTCRLIPARRDPRVLGHALIDSRTRTGVLATVFIDRTRRVAGDLGLDHRVLLGRAIAHELGHLLLATPTHGSAGLMREVWSRDELLGTHRDDWIFDRVRCGRHSQAAGARAAADVRAARRKTVVSGFSRTFTRMVARSPPGSRILTRPAGGHMPVRHAASGIAVVSALLVATDAFAHHSFAPHFDSSKPVSISGTITEFEAQNPHSYVHIAAVDENGRTQEYVCESHGVTQLTRNGVTPQILKVGHEDPGHRLAVAAQSVHVLLQHRGARRRSRAQRQRTHRPAAGDGGAADAQGHLRHLDAGADRQPQHQRPAADDPVDDAGRREGRRRLRSVQGRSDVPLRSGRDPPRVGRTGHAARDRARRATTSCCATSGWTCAASST